VKSKKSPHTLEIHRYTLWRNDRNSIADDLAISMGKHGAMDTNPIDDRGSSSEHTLHGLATHNLAEIRRAMEESRKWEVRLKDAPLGKTQQDFVAYYTEVIAIFTEWHTTNGISLPD